MCYYFFMYLKSIEIQGFKSFARKVNIDFKSAVTAIVGANGSGKSNVAEAFRFVLGEQSIKSLRGKKGEDLIWNGAGETPRANRASVKVTFDNKDKLFNVDFDKVIIERVVHRDGINDYLINGSQVRLRDVIELLSDAHIGASGHHIISQGEADRILNANMRERRTILEDALGLKIYQYKRQESERKLEKTLQNIEQVNALRKEIAPHLKFLKRQVEKVEKAEELKKELLNLAKEYLKRESLFVEGVKKEIENARGPLEKNKKKLDEELENAKKILESKDKDEKTDKLIVLESDIHSVRMEKEKCLQELVRIQGEILGEERILKKQKEASIGASSAVSLEEIEGFKAQIDEKITEGESKNDINLVKKIFAEIKTLFNEFLSSQINKNKIPLKDSEDLIKKLTNEKDDLTLKLNSASEKESHLQKEYQVLQKAIEKEKDSNRDAEKSVFRIMSEQNKIYLELQMLGQKMESILHLEGDLKRELEECAILAGKEILDYNSFELQVSEEVRSLQEERRRRIEKIKVRLEDAGASGFAEIIKEFEEVNSRDSFLSGELDDLNKSAQSLHSLTEELGEKIDTEFNIGIEKINKQFQEFFTLMFGGGVATLKIKNENRETM